MKKLFRILPLVLLTSCATPLSQKVSNDGIVAGVSAPQILQLMGNSYEARYSASDTTKAIVEYYLPGEGPKSWTRMLALRLNVAGPSSLQQVTSMERSIRAGGSSAVASYNRKDSVGYGIDFILTAHGYQEMDVFRYVDRTNLLGSVSYQYAEIIPNQNVRGLEKSKLVEYYKNLRMEAVKAMWAAPMPTIEKLP